MKEESRIKAIKGKVQKWKKEGFKVDELEEMLEKVNYNKEEMEAVFREISPIDEKEAVFREIFPIDENAKTEKQQ